ncbi:DUF2786 domain-containing protein [Amycolatopsis sp. CA-230715]|uniref:DUF2786 domain-containing protein n=1 Tax=Amycolatopsis sp. CA-230715 TaxID=2745196 RepID=UPI001C009EAE|nr:DUF2786 domain-containing protein [Amycolatopsis sp. CA-230715]QWF78781.1 hypothetical protein HUW46_02179 [Amycolatopsis sp. CA-230715]
MTTTTHADVWDRGRATARTLGAAPALYELQRFLLPGLLPFSRDGFAVLPAGLAADTSQVWLDGTVLDRGRERLLPGELDAPGGPLVQYRHPAPHGDAPHGDVVRLNWARGLAGVRLGLSEALLERCVDYLAGRHAQDGSLLLHPVLKDALADALIDQLEAAAVLHGDGPAPRPRLLRHVHERLSGADRGLLRTLGASGFTAAGAGRLARASELLADAYASNLGKEE